MQTKTIVNKLDHKELQILSGEHKGEYISYSRNLEYNNIYLMKNATDMFNGKKLYQRESKTPLTITQIKEITRIIFDYEQIKKEIEQ